MMNNINEILERYWEGETNLEEENLISQYFESNQVSEEHKMYADLFTQLNEEREVKAPDMSAYIERITSIGSASTTTKAKVVNLSFKKYFYAAAAVMTLGLASIFLFKSVPSTANNQTVVVSEIDDPEEALEVTMQALALVSKKMNHSTEKVKEEMQVLQKVSIFQ